MFKESEGELELFTSQLKTDLTLPTSRLWFEPFTALDWHSALHSAACGGTPLSTLPDPSPPKESSASLLSITLPTHFQSAPIWHACHRLERDFDDQLDGLLDNSGNALPFLPICTDANWLRRSVDLQPNPRGHT